MANVSDVGDSFTVERLRGAQPGARGVTLMPVARAYGPVNTGPSAATMAANDSWILSCPLPNEPDITWVLVRGEPVFSFVSGIGGPNSYYATVDTGDGELAPLLGPGGNVIYAHRVGAVYDRIGLPYFMQNATSCWVPLTRPDTAGAGTVRFYATASTPAPGVDDWEADLRGIVLLGYPAQLWQTGVLWGASQNRGV